MIALHLVVGCSRSLLNRSIVAFCSGNMFPGIAVVDINNRNLLYSLLVDLRFELLVTVKFYYVASTFVVDLKYTIH